MNELSKTTINSSSTRQPISTLRIYWEGKQLGFYIRRVSRNGFVSGFLTQHGGWSNCYRAACFPTKEQAIEAANAAKSRIFDVLINQGDEDADGHISRGEAATMPPYNC